MNFDFSVSLIRKSCQRFVFVMAFLFTSTTLAQGLDSLLDTQDQFLPEAEAYVVSPALSETEVSFTWAIEDGYYLYKHQFGLKLNTDEGQKALEFSVPEGIIKFDKVFQKDFEVYYANVTLSAEITPLPDNFEFVLNSQGCADAGLCYSPRTQYFSLKDGLIQETSESVFEGDFDSETAVSSNTAPSNKASKVNPTANADEESRGLLFILVGAMVGGMILNLMPCVFPVLSLKALTLASGNQSEHRVNGWAYTAGVVLSFLVVAIIIIVAKSAGSELGWGFQLQQPSFVAALIYLFFLLGMNMFGLFEIGTGWMGVGQKLTQGNGAASSFFTGVLAAVVASPCTAPFMATAIGYTLTQGNIVTMTVFIALGFGMALPYLVLSHSHTLASRLPNPGPWMETFKQFLAFPLLFTCVWLLVVIGNQTSAYASALIVGGAIALAMALWLLKKQPQSVFKWAVRLLAILLIAAALKLALQITRYAENDTGIWEPYSTERLAELRKDGQAVFVDMTADWCITCKINERVALDIDSVTKFAALNDIYMLRGDWTKSDPEITALLHEFNRNGVPLYLMYPANRGGAPEILPQLLTPSAVLAAMERAIEE